MNLRQLILIIFTLILILGVIEVLLYDTLFILFSIAAGLILFLAALGISYLYLDLGDKK